jgi:hypothetical protein
MILSPMDIGSHVMRNLIGGVPSTRDLAGSDRYLCQGTPSRDTGRCALATLCLSIAYPEPLVRPEPYVKGWLGVLQSNSKFSQQGYDAIGFSGGSEARRFLLLE